MPMNKRLILSPRFWLPMVAVLLLGVGFLFYYLLIVQAQDAALDDQAFRVLAAVSRQISDTANNYAEIMRRSSDDNFRAFVAEQVPGLEIDDPCPDGPSIRPFIADDGSALQFQHGKDCGHVNLNAALTPLVNGTPHLTFDEVILATSEGRVLYQTHTTGLVAADLSAFMQITQSGSSPTPRASTKQSEAATNASPLFETSESSAFFSASQSSNLASITLAGVPYRAYLVPIVPNIEKTGRPPGDASLVLCGLMQEERFRTSGRAISGSVLTLFALTVLLVIVATWPLLKFSTMKPTERVPGNAGLYYAVSTAATIMMAIVLVIGTRDLFYDPETEENLDSLGTAIENHLKSELQQALNVMKSIEGSEEFRNAKVIEQSPGHVCVSHQDQPLARKPNLLRDASVQLAAYPYFRRFYAYDGDGFEQMKWTVDPAEPPSLRACDRPYFVKTMGNELWYFDGELNGPRFRVDPIYSHLSGEYLAVIAMPAEVAGSSKTSTPRVLTLVTPLLSLIQPVLPPDYGFAVIDDSGKVLFHSDAARNGRENFLDQTSDPAQLRAAIAAGRKDAFTLDYSGASHRIHILPLTSIQHSHWYLVTFTNLSTAGTERAERLVLFSALIVIYFVAVVIPCALALKLLGRKRASWFWPMEDKKGIYLHLALTLTAAMLLFYPLALRAEGTELLVFALEAPILAVIIAFLKLTHREPWIFWISTFVLCLGGVFEASAHSRELQFFIPYALIYCCCLSLCFVPATVRLQRARISFQTSFALGVFCLLIMTAAPTSIALYRAAYDYEENMSTRREQLVTMEALEARERRVVEQYLDVKISKGNPPLKEDVAKWLFLRRRLEEQKLDVYDTVFQDQQQGIIFNPRARTDREEPPPLLSMLASWLPISRGSLTSKLSRTPDDHFTWQFSPQGAHRINIRRMYDDKISRNGGSPQTLALAKLAFNDPAYLTGELAYDLDCLQPWKFFVSVTLPLFLLLCGMYFSVRSTLCKMFLIGETMPSAWPEISIQDALDRDGNMMLVGFPCSDVSATLESQNIGATNMALFLQEKQSAPEKGAGTVVLDHFDFEMDKDSTNNRKLELLQELLKERRKIVIITTIDPLFYFETVRHYGEEHPGTGQERYRMLQSWAKVLEQFTTYRLNNKPKIWNEISCAMLRSTCTPLERAALYGLACDGWANYKNRAALEHLAKRGLIQSTPRFQIAPEYGEFARYLRGAMTPEERSSWDVLHTPHLFEWDGLRVMFIILLLGTVAAVLIFNKHNVLGYVTGAVSAVTPLAKLWSDMRGGGSKAGGAVTA